ncbi:MAG: BatD family protein [Myxococcota bacterium]|jgi:hypothetical protein|nr:BatD family protein [Myxococcota bacterium]
MAACVALVALTTTAAAQKAHIQISQGPYYQGEAVDVHLIVEDFEEDPTPEVEVVAPKGARLDFTGVSPSTRSSISIVNGRMTQTKEVRFVYQYRFVAGEAGRYALGPFRVSQGGTSRTTGPVQVEIQALGRSDRVRIKTTWPSDEVFPGQRIEVNLEWSFEAELNDRMRDYRIEVPIFNRGDLFRYVDDPPQRGDREVVVQTSAGPLSLRADITDRVENGRRFNVVKARRTLIPLKPGRFEFSGATVMVEEVVRWRRDLFGQRTPQAVRKLPTIDERRTLVVSDVPLAGRPESYAGAIGRGFSFEVSADRSVVQVGDPIGLTLVLRGDGNLDGAGLADLSTSAGLSPERFRVPTAPQAGVVKDGAKTFHLQLRVLDAGVREIPPIPYSYFDTDKREYVTVVSRPIALSVRRAQVITADDVVSGAKDEEGEEGGPSHSPLGATDEAQEREQPALGDFALAGANLSIVRDPARLVARGANAGGGVLPALLYGFSLAAVVGAFFFRRQRDLDPEVVVRQRGFAAARKQIAKAAGEPRSRAMGQLADALRAMLRAAPGSQSAELDAFLSECDAVAYAPDGGGHAAVDRETIDRAQALAKAIEEGAS